MTKLNKPLVLSIVASVFMLLMASSQAAIVTTTEIVSDSNRTQLLEKLQRKDVQQQLTEMGVDSQAAIGRVNNLTDEEIAQINGKLNNLPAGAGTSTTELLLIIIIILLII